MNSPSDTTSAPPTALFAANQTTSSVDTDTQEALELPSLLALVACKAATDLGRQEVLALQPLASDEALRQAQRRHEQAERLILAQGLIPSCERPFAALLAALESGGHGLQGRDLVSLGDLLQISTDAQQRIRAAEPPCEELDELTRALPPVSDLGRRIRKTFDRRGEMREDASPRLTELRRQIRSVRDHVYQELSTHLEKHREYLSEETIPLRGERLVLVLQSGARGRIPGLIHGRSASGKSFYFEPLGAVEPNNRLQQAIEDEGAEKRRILAELLTMTRRELPAILLNARFVACIDCLQAAVRYSQICGGRLAEVGPRHELRLGGARHPLLDPALSELRREALGKAGHEHPIVALDIELSKRRHALVVTGPNAGGKTVALKTTGLLALAHLCGLPIPCDRGSRLPFLRRIVATIGDDQDLLADRSTFSGRLLRLREVWHAAGADSLLLLDELGSGTDPEEGSALSKALLEHLVARRSLAVITTHLSPLAATALEIEGAFCASMQFDTATGSPTYRLLPGPPGGSEALALARRLGLPAAWLDRAEELLGKEHRELRRLLSEVEKSRRELAHSQSLVDIELRDSEKLRQRLATQEAALATERQTLAKSLQKQLAVFQDEVRRKLRDEAERMRSELASGRKKGVERAAAERLFEQVPVFDVEQAEAVGEVVVGGQVEHRQFGWQGTLERVDRGRAQVRVHGKLLQCDENDLRPTAEPLSARKPHSRPRPDAASDLEEEMPSEINLIGQRVEPALESLDHFLDRALLASKTELRVIHGYGSGRLRKAVRAHLHQHPAVAGQRSGDDREGGGGATIVSLRN